MRADRDAELRVPRRFSQENRSAPGLAAAKRAPQGSEPSWSVRRVSSSRRASAGLPPSGSVIRTVLVATTAPLGRKRSRSSSRTGASKQEGSERHERAVRPRQRGRREGMRTIIESGALSPGSKALFSRPETHGLAPGPTATTKSPFPFPRGLSRAGKGLLLRRTGLKLERKGLQAVAMASTGSASSTKPHPSVLQTYWTPCFLVTFSRRKGAPQSGHSRTIGFFQRENLQSG